MSISVMAPLCILIITLVVVASIGCGTNRDEALEPSENSIPGDPSTYVELTDEELDRMVPGPHDEELYTNVIEVSMHESGTFSKDDKELTFDQLISLVAEQTKIEDVQLKINVPDETSMDVIARLQRKISNAMPELERVSVVFQPNKANE